MNVPPHVLELKDDIMGLILSPNVVLRKDGGRAVIFSVNPIVDKEEPVFRLLHPQHAVILSLFDGEKDLREVTETVAYLFDTDIEAASQELETLFNLHVTPEKTIGSLVVDVSTIDREKARVYDPSDFIVPVDTIEMSNPRLTMPCALVVLPTMRCFTDCIYCYANREGVSQYPEFDLNLYKRLLNEVKECRIETIDISGGDLFCRSDAFDLIKCTLEEGIYLNIPTKYPLSKDQVNRLADMGLSTIQVSIDACSHNIIDKMVNRSGYGKKILKTLDYLGEAGIQVRTKTVLTPYNIRDAVHLARHLAQRTHIDGCRFSPYSRSLYRHRDDLFCSDGELEEFERELNKIRAEFPQKSLLFSGIPPDPYTSDEVQRRSIFWKRPSCAANQRAAVVLPNGKVTICEELYMHEDFIIGDLTKQTLKEVWNSPRAIDITHPDQSSVPDGSCKDCPDFQLCHEGRGRCIRDVLKAYGYKNAHWPDPRCPRAPVGNRLI